MKYLPKIIFYRQTYLIIKNRAWKSILSRWFTTIGGKVVTGSSLLQLLHKKNRMIRSTSKQKKFERWLWQKPAQRFLSKSNKIQNKHVLKDLKKTLLTNIFLSMMINFLDIIKTKNSKWRNSRFKYSSKSDRKSINRYIKASSIWSLRSSMNWGKIMENRNDPI